MASYDEWPADDDYSIPGEELGDNVEEWPPMGEEDDVTTTTTNQNSNTGSENNNTNTKKKNYSSSSWKSIRLGDLHVS